MDVICTRVDGEPVAGERGAVAKARGRLSG